MSIARLLRRKTLDQLVGDSIELRHKLQRALGPVQLTALGVGAAVGAGVFSSIGSAFAGHSASTRLDTDYVHRRKKVSPGILRSPKTTD
jgi:APA family basic amino acid/polyamine antiporter